MTFLIQLPSSSGGPPTPLPASSFATPSSEPEEALRQVVARLRTGKRIVFVSGAGVSTHAAIPDFRSAAGLFNGKTKGGYSVKDLFHVKCLASPTLLAKHHELITSLASLSTSAPPTPFHSYLSTLDQEGRLLRCYTQNIDGLEDKAGMGVGIPAGVVKRRAAGKGKGKVKAEEVEEGRVEAVDGPVPSAASTAPTVTPDTSGPPTTTTEPTTPAPPPSPPEPRVIPLHGLLTTLHCVLCHTLLPLPPHLPLPPTAIPCPTCQLHSSIRSALSERTRRTGSLRASVVLYGEEHPQGELIGKSVERDLKGVDTLVVLGTSLSVPGVKRVVKEMARAVHSRNRTANGKKPEPRVVFVNDEPPSKASEWEGVFDVWVKADVQRFVMEYLANGEYSVAPRKTVTPKKGKATAAGAAGEGVGAKEKATPTKKAPSTPKKRKTPAPPTPVSLEKGEKGNAKAWDTPTKPRVGKNAASTAVIAGSKRGAGVPLTPESVARPVKRVKLEADAGAQPSAAGDAEARDRREASPSPRRRLDFEGSLSPVPS
ncbi:hypothetical protein IAT38_004082 [Cryptococcus sp. DSM 104549]